MEHRWGERVSVRLIVELSCGASAPVAGLLENVSSSGAFVRTDGCRLRRGAVEITLLGAGERDSSVHLPAYIVRESESGVGIEWCEFAPRAVRELMRQHRRAGERARARARPSMRRSPRRPNMAAEPAAPSMAEPAGGGGDTVRASASLGREAGAAR